MCVQKRVQERAGWRERERGERKRKREREKRRERKGEEEEREGERRRERGGQKEERGKKKEKETERKKCIIPIKLHTKRAVITNRIVGVDLQGFLVCLPSFTYIFHSKVCLAFPDVTLDLKKPANSCNTFSSTNPASAAVCTCTH